MSKDRLVFQRQLKDGRVVAFNVWPTGWQELVYPSLKVFEKAKVFVEQQGGVPTVTGYTEVR